MASRAQGRGVTKRAAVLGCLILAVSFAALVAVGCSGSSPTEATGTGPADESSAGGPSEVSLLVSAAAGLKDAFSDIGRRFDEVNGSETVFNFAAGGALEKQIEGGAPADIFATPDPTQMDDLLKKGLVDGPTIEHFACSEVVLIVPADSTLGITGFTDLAREDVERVATGDPAITTVGVATLEILPALDMLETVQPKLIYGQTVNQAVDYVARGEVDAALVWAAEAKTRGEKVKVVATADQAWYRKVEFVIGTVAASENAILSRAFIDFVMSADGQAVLAEYGFSEPRPSRSIL